MSKLNIVGIAGQAGSGKDEIANHLVNHHGFKKVALADPIKRFALNVFNFDVIQLWGPSSARNTFDPRYGECNIRSSGIEFSPGSNMSSAKRATDPGWGEAAVRLSEYGPEWVKEVVSGDREEALNKLYFWFSSLGHHYPQLSPRIMLQHLGTEWGRYEIDQDIWIDALIRTAGRVLLGYEYSKETGFSHEQTEPPVGVVVSDVRFSNELSKIKDVKGHLIQVTRESASSKASKLGITNHASEAEQKAFKKDLFDAVLTNEGSLKELYSAVDIVAAAHLGGNNVD